MPASNEPTSVWMPEIVDRIASYLHDNELACTLRLVCRATAQQFASRTIVHPAQPVPRWCFAAECRRVCRGLTLAKRRRLLCLTAASGVTVNVEAAVAETGCPLTVEALEASAGAGQLLMCQWLVAAGRIAWNEATATLAGQAAAAGGHGLIADWSLAPRGGTPNGPGPNCALTVIKALLRKGHEEMAWRLAETHTPWSDWWLDYIPPAAAGCSLAGLKRAVEHYTVRSGGVLPLPLPASLDPDALPLAVCSPTPDWKDKAQFLIELGVTVREGACCVVAHAQSGSAAIERLAWLRSKGAALSRDCLTAAARRGDTVLVAYLLEQGLPAGREDVASAARVGSLATVQALVAVMAVGASRDLPYVATHMAGAGHVEGLAWLVETYGAGAVGGLTPGLFHQAAASGSVELLVWLLARGCGADWEAWRAAAEAGCEAALQLLDDRGCPKPAQDSEAPAELYWSAARMSDLRTMAALRRLGFPFGRDGGRALFVRVAGGLHRAADAQRVLTWLHAHGCRVDWAGAEKAVGQTHWSAERRRELRAWIAQQRAPPPAAADSESRVS